jgi:AAA15 family ATPase/GTPase
MNDEGVDLLRNAIVIQAAKDYKRSFDYRSGACDEFDREEIEQFFRSEWYEQLTDVNSEYIMNEIKRMIKKEKEDARKKDHKTA